MTAELERRWERAQARMAELAIDAIAVGPSADLTYLTGFSGRQSERLLLFVLPQSGRPRLIVPRFEAPRLEEVLAVADARLWDDGDDPVALLPTLLPTKRRARIGLGSDLFARFVLAVARSVPDPQLIDAAAVLVDLRVRKSPQELELLRAASAAADATLDDLVSRPITGQRESDLATFIATRLVENGHDVAGHTIVAFGSHAALPHHHSGNEAITEGPALFDFGGTLGGYHSDLTRTVAVGKAEAELRSVHDCVRHAADVATEMIRPGVLSSELDAAARSVIEEAGYGPFFAHRLGHGIGLDVHEPPYLVAGDETELDPGMVFSIEPGIYLPGKFGVRIEDVVAVTDDGYERLTTSSRELQVLS